MMKIKDRARSVSVRKLFARLMEKVLVFVHLQNHFSMEKNAIHAIYPHFGMKPLYCVNNALKDTSTVFKSVDALDAPLIHPLNKMENV